MAAFRLRELAERPGRVNLERYKRDGESMPDVGLEETIQMFFDAFNRGDLDAIIALYEANATMVPQPGQSAEGQAAIRKALNGFAEVGT
jgi:ketosteroid isomerase-like protein